METEINGRVRSTGVRKRREEKEERWKKRE